MKSYFDKPLEELEEHQLNHLLEMMEKYSSSEEWQFIEGILRRQLLAAARGLAQPGVIATDTLHFQRGAMWAADQFVMLPSQIAFQLKNALLMVQSKTPAKAGKEL